MFESRRDGGLVTARIVARFGLGRRDISDRLQQSSMIEPVDPFEGGELDGFETAPGPASMDDLGLVEAVDRLCERVVVAVANAADGRDEARLDQAIRVLDRYVLGGFKRSSQHLDGSCDEHSKTAFGSFWAVALVLTRSTAGGRARGAAAILGSDCGGHGE